MILNISSLKFMHHAQFCENSTAYNGYGNIKVIQAMGLQSVPVEN